MIYYRRAAPHDYHTRDRAYSAGVCKTAQRKGCALRELASSCRDCRPVAIPIAASGDYEEMGLKDVLYWIHKAKHHIVHPERGSKLEVYFKEQPGPDLPVPAEFEVEAELSVSAVGDLMNHEYLTESPGLYRHVADEVFGADLSMANLETVVLDRPSEAPRFDGKTAPRLRVEGSVLDVLIGYEQRRYDFVSTACNHSLDFGVEGVTSTADALEKRGVAFHGTILSESEARHARILERRGLRVAVVSHTFGLNGWQPPPGKPWIVNRSRLNGPVQSQDFSAIERQIAHARSEKADFVIAQLHWGMEFEHYPRAAQLDVAHALAERGLDAIFGHHPHVIQPFELYRTQRDPARIVPIFYSLGNLTNAFRDPRLCRSLLAHLNLIKGRRSDGSLATYVRDCRAKTIVQSTDLRNRTIELVDSEAGS